MDVVGELEGVLPFDNLAVAMIQLAFDRSWSIKVHSRIVRVFGAERRPPNHALKHDSSQRPPITTEGISVATKNLRCNVVWCSDSRVGHAAPRLTP